MLLTRSPIQCSPPSRAEPRPRTLPSSVELSPRLISPLPECRTTAQRVSSSAPTKVSDRASLVGAKLEILARVHDEVADAGQQMLEECPGQADQDDNADPGRSQWRLKSP